MSTARVPTADALAALAVLLPLVALWCARRERGTDTPEPFAPATTDALRGIGATLLLLGHFFYTRVDATLPVGHAGEWAVAVFLFASGLGLSIRYPGRVRIREFARRRFSRVLVPAWVVLVVGLAAEAFAQRPPPPVTRLPALLLGIVQQPPNEHFWFVAYILFWYVAYASVAATCASKTARVAGLAALGCGGAFAVAALPALAPLAVSGKYALVFPLGVAVGAGRHWVAALSGRLRHRIPALICAFAVCAAVGGMRPLFAQALAAHGLRRRYLLPGDALALLCLGLAAALLALLLESGGASFPNLRRLGGISYEIYLVHWALMTRGDVFFARQPLAFGLALFVAAVTVSALALRAATRAAQSAGGRFRGSSAA